MNIADLTATAADATSLAAKSKDNPDKVLNAAKQFESLLIAQLMKSMQDNEGGWLSAGDDDQSSSAAMEYGQEAFAQAMSANGGLGLAKMVASGLERSAKV
jgi:Rod binding domain-containing protein